MPNPTFAPNAVVPQLVAAQALTQLNHLAVFPRAARGDYENKAFQKGDTVTVRRARIVEAEDYDPRSGLPATSTEPGYMSSTIQLEKLFTAGFPVYGHDNNDAVSKYVVDYGRQIAASITTKADKYFYSKFRSFSANYPAAGPCAYGAHPPVGMVASVKSDGEFDNFNKNTLIQAGSILDRNNVPADERFSIISTTAKSSFLGDSVLVEGFVAAAAGASSLLTQGMPVGTFVPRYGFLTAGSNAINYQMDVPNIGGGSSLAISSVAPDTDFTFADIAIPTLLGAVKLTLSAPVQNVGVGHICRIGAAGAPATAYGLVLRISGSVVSVVPFAPSGVQLLPTQITPGTDAFSIPLIPSISVAYHVETLTFASRLLATPSQGSGASMVTVSDAQTALAIQIIQGNYKVDEFKESQRYASLMGALLTDHRKAVLMLSL